MPQYPPCTLERVWEAHGLPVLRAAIDLPAPAESSRIRKFYALQSRAYLRYCESFLLPRATAEAERCLEGSRPFHPHQAELTGRVTFQEGPLLSLRVQSREEGEGIFLQHRGDTWDLAAGTPVSLGQFLQKPRRWKGLFYEAASADMDRRIRCCALPCREDWRRTLRRSLNPRNFYLTEEGLAFFVPMYALGDTSLGIPTFLLPWCEENCVKVKLPPVSGGSFQKHP